MSGFSQKFANETHIVAGAGGVQMTMLVRDRREYFTDFIDVSDCVDPRFFDGEDAVFSFADEQTVAIGVSPSAEPRQRGYLLPWRRVSAASVSDEAAFSDDASRAAPQKGMSGSKSRGLRSVTSCSRQARWMSGP